MKTKSNQILNTFEFMLKTNGDKAAELYGRGDLFSLKDHAIVKRAVQSVLSEDEQEVVILHFWSDLELPEISNLLILSQKEVTCVFESALRKIRRFCLGEADFSQAKIRQPSMVA